VLVPPQHGERLARNVPDADVVIDEQGGHFPDPNLVTERFAGLSSRSDALLRSATYDDEIGTRLRE